MLWLSLVLPAAGQLVHEWTRQRGGADQEWATGLQVGLRCANCLRGRNLARKTCIRITHAMPSRVLSLETFRLQVLRVPKRRFELYPVIAFSSGTLDAVQGGCCGSFIGRVPVVEFSLLIGVDEIT